MPRDWLSRIDDILEAILRIERYTAGITFEEFELDRKTVDAVVYNFAVIGEAATAIPADVQTKYPQIAWREMRLVRNIVIHAYFGVSLPIIWETLQRDLPALRQHLEALLASERDSA